MWLGAFVGVLFLFGIWQSRNRENDAATETTSTQVPAPAQQTAKPPITNPSLSATELQQLTAQRQHALDMIAAINGILEASSFVKQAEVYCRFYVDQAPSIPLPGISSEKQAEERYGELMNTEPPTREEELTRQYQLRALRDRIAAFDQSVSECQGMVTAGVQRIPGPDELRKDLANIQQAVADIDQKISGP